MELLGSGKSRLWMENLMLQVREEQGIGERSKASISFHSNERQLLRLSVIDDRNCHPAQLF
jgi:hypothetical protein